MNIEIISIGRELLDGRTIDTNSVYFGESLRKKGHVPRFYQRVDDHKEDIVAAFELAASRSQIIFVTGGLGPTSDDLTTEVFAGYLDLELKEDPESRKDLESKFKVLNKTMHDSQLKQALFPKGATPLKNDAGTAPGFYISAKGCEWYFMPGVPGEMKFIFENSVAHKLPDQKGFRRTVWMTQFTSEGELQQKLKDVIASLPKEISFFYRTRFPENHLGLSGVLDSPSLEKSFQEASVKIENVLEDTYFSKDEGESLESAVIDLARQNKQTLTSVESCTGGLVSSRITDISGSSDVWWGAFCTYDNTAKISLAKSVGLESEMLEALEKHGAVSEQVASLMALCGAKKTASETQNKDVLCVSTTGVAGPGGGTEEKPVGTCCLAVSNAEKVLKTMTVRARRGLSRDKIKLYFSQHALNELRLMLTD